MSRNFRVLPLPMALCLASSSALSQQKAATTDSARTRLPEVTVTASRSGGLLFETPLAVTRLTKTSWQGTSGYGLNDALSLVPGVLAQSRYGNNDIRLIIRGFGARGAGDRSNAGTARGIRILLNGVPETEPDGRTSFDGVDLASAEGIEVVRSNASALWGNAAGGVVNINTIPEYTAPFVEEENIVGGFGLKRFAAKAGTIYGSSRLFGSLVNSSFDGWRMHSSSTRTIFDGGLVAPLGDRTTFSALVMASKNHFLIPGPLTQAQVDADPTQSNATYASRHERRDNTIGRIALTLGHQMDDANGFSTMAFVTPKYLQRSERGSYRDFNRYHTGGNFVYRNRSTYSGDTKGSFSLGSDAAFQDGSIQFYSLTPAGDRGTELKDNKAEGAANFGVFANEDLDIGANWLLSVGARYDAINYTYRNYITPQINATKAFAKVTPKIGLSYKLSPTHVVYANLGGGLEAPAGNETDPAPTFGQDTVTAISPLLDAISSTTVEAGTRHAFVQSSDAFIREISYDAAVFLTHVTNEIIPYAGGKFYFTAGKVQRTGAELGATIRAAGGFAMQGAFTLMKAEYKSYLVDSVHYGRAGHYADFSGHRMVGVPDVMLNANLSWSPEALHGLRMQVGVTSTGDYFVDDANTVRVPGASVFTVGLLTNRAWELGGGIGMRGSLSVNNAADTRYMGSAYLNPDKVNGVPVAFEPGLARQVIVSLAFERRR